MFMEKIIIAGLIAFGFGIFGMLWASGLLRGIMPDV